MRLWLTTRQIATVRANPNPCAIWQPVGSSAATIVEDRGRRNKFRHRQLEGRNHKGLRAKHRFVVIGKRHSLFDQHELRSVLDLRP